MCCNENCATCVCKHVAMCVWMWPRACPCVCEYLLAPTMPCISLVIGASEAKPLSSGWCENRKFGFLHGCVVGSCVVSVPNYMVCTFVRRVHTIDGTYVVHIPILVHTSSLERALNPANRRGHLTRSSFHRGLHKATSGKVHRVRAELSDKKQSAIAGFWTMYYIANAIDLYILSWFLFCH